MGPTHQGPGNTPDGDIESWEEEALRGGVLTSQIDRLRLNACEGCLLPRRSVEGTGTTHHGRSRCLLRKRGRQSDANPASILVDADVQMKSTTIEMYEEWFYIPFLSLHPVSLFLRSTYNIFEYTSLWSEGQYRFKQP